MKTSVKSSPTHLHNLRSRLRRNDIKDIADELNENYHYVSRTLRNPSTEKLGERQIKIIEKACQLINERDSLLGHVFYKWNIS